MTDPQDIPGRLRKSFTSIWTSHAGSAPSDVTIKIDDDVVTCTLDGAFGDFGGKEKGYKQEVVAAVVRLTGRQVASFHSSHDAKAGIATEVFTLKPSTSKRKAGPDKQFAHAFWLSPMPPTEAEAPE
jgi:hypothetical protein